MSIFLARHKIPAGVTEEEIKEGYETYKKSAQEAGLKPLGAVVSTEKGFAYCQTEADSAEAVAQAHQKVGIAVEDVIKVKLLS